MKSGIEMNRIAEIVLNAETELNLLDDLSDEEFEPAAARVEELLQACNDLISSARRYERIKRSGLRLA